MTVAELIERLSELPQDANVRVMQEDRMLVSNGRYQVQLESDLRDLAVTKNGVVLIGKEVE